jgi:hypothetical protein
MRLIMFPSHSIQATLDQGKREYNKHVLNVRWEGFQCVWLLYDLDSKELNKYKPKSGTTLDLVLSEEVVCVGDFRKEEYTPCPYEFNVSRTSQCRFCSKTLIENQNCIFEPRCHGDECRIDTGNGNTDICREEHAVYLAFYGEHTKIGMTLGPRLRTRLIEQGADAYSLIGMFPDRLAAREFEREVSKQLKIPERVHPSRILTQMSVALDREEIKDNYLEAKGFIKKNRDMNIGNLHWLTDYPIETLRTKPRKRDTPGRHSGKVVGLKGKFLVYEESGLNVLNMNQVPGRFCSMD